MKPYKVNTKNEIILNAIQKNHLNEYRHFNNTTTKRRYSSKQDTIKTNAASFATSMKETRSSLPESTFSKTAQLPRISSVQENSMQTTRFVSNNSRSDEYIKITINGQESPESKTPRIVKTAITRRRQSFKLSSRWEKRRMEDINITCYSKRTINEKKLQYKILLDKFYILAEKWFKLHVIINNGIKVLLLPHKLIDDSKGYDG